MSFAGLRPGQDRSTIVTLTNSDKASLYLELVSIYALQRKFNVANDLMEEARSQLTGTSEYCRTLIGSAELNIDMDEIDRAIDLLNSIEPGQPYYLQACTKLAEIHLKHRKDRQSFAKCFRYTSVCKKLFLFFFFTIYNLL